MVNTAPISTLRYTATVERAEASINGQFLETLT